MAVTTYILGIAAAVMVIVVVLEMLRRGRFRERHATWWLIAGVIALIVSVFPATLEWAAALVGVQVPTNLVFFVLIAILFFVCLQHGAELTVLEEKTRTLAEHSALHQVRLDALENAQGVEAQTDVPRADSAAQNAREASPIRPTENPS